MVFSVSCKNTYIVQNITINFGFEQTLKLKRMSSMFCNLIAAQMASAAVNIIFKY